MKIEVVSAVSHSTVHQAVLSRKYHSIFCAGPYEILPLETCFEPLPSTSSLSQCPVECLQLSLDERSIGVATNALLKIADIESGREIRNLTGHTLPISSLASSKCSVYSWYTGSSDLSWSQWDTRMHPSKILGARTNGGVVRSIAISPGDRFVAVGTDHSIQLFDARQRQYVKQFNCSGHNLEFNPTEVLLSSIGHDRIVRFFCLESLEMISQSDPFLDDIQASAFDTHLMITATNESINLMTWEPCDILTTVPLKNIEKVVNISVNSGVELDFICIGDTTERLEMRSYSIEELLSYSPNHELSGSIYEEDEEYLTVDFDVSPTEETKSLPGHVQQTFSTEVMTKNKENLMSSPESSSIVSASSSSPLESSQSSPSSPIRPAALKTRSISQKSRKNADVKEKLEIKKEFSTLSRLAPPSTKSNIGEKMSIRSSTPSLPSKPPTKALTHPRSSSSTTAKFLRQPKPSPSMTDLRMKSSLGGSAQSLVSDKDAKKRSVSTQRNTEAFTISYINRPRTPSESDGSFKKFNAPKSPVTINQRNASPSTGITRKPVISPTKKGVSSKLLKPKSVWMDGFEDIYDEIQKSNNDLKAIRKYGAKNGSDVLISKSVTNQERLSLMAIHIINKKNDWALNSCHQYLPILIDHVLSIDNEARDASLDGLEVISQTMLEKLVKFSHSNSRIGVDVAAEERAEKARECIEQIKEMTKKRDWYYKQLSEDAVCRLDGIFECFKSL